MSNDPKAEDPKLVSPAQFKQAMNRLLSVSKAESDKQIADLQASNAKKREDKKMG